MSWPHLLSFSRVIAGPIVAALVLAKPGDTYLLAAALFAVASLTDLLDGKLARYKRRVSPLGIFLDTTSDKVLVSLTLIAMAMAGLAQAWVPLVIIGRELLISGLRSYAASCGELISAHSWGKGKAAVTMLAILCVLISADAQAGGAARGVASHHAWSSLGTGSAWLLGAAAVLTIISGLRYVIDAWPLFREERAADADEPRRAAVAGGKR